MRFVVARLADFPAETRRLIRVGGREIGVFRVGDRFYAVRNRCPHQGGPLCEGNLASRVASTSLGRVELGDGSRIVCPWHGWQYDMETGEPHAPGDPAARTYGVAVERGPLSPAELEPVGHAEIFDVTVEDEFVVVDA
jgi:nitrite reductase/ring-hydroxylating ferredoxin subunit